MKLCKILLQTLLVLLMLAALAACGSSDGADAKRADNNDFKFLQGERVSRADVDFMLKLPSDDSEFFTETDMVFMAAMRRAILLEAESQDMLISRDEALATAKEKYQEWQTILKDESNPEYDNAKWRIDWAQRIMQAASLTEAEYVEYLAVSYQISEAYGSLYDQHFADVDLVEHEDYVAASVEMTNYIEDLIEKYYDVLVEEDLQPLLDEYYAK